MKFKLPAMTNNHFCHVQNCVHCQKIQQNSRVRDSVKFTAEQQK